jgi:hypothetical protein
MLWLVNKQLVYGFLNFTEPSFLLKYSILFNDTHSILTIKNFTNEHFINCYGTKYYRRGLETFREINRLEDFYLCTGSLKLVAPNKDFISDLFFF